MADKRGVQCYNCQKFGHFAKHCFQQKKDKAPQGSPSSKARVAAPNKGSEDEDREQANVILRQMGAANDRVKGYIARTVGENFHSA